MKPAAPIASERQEQAALFAWLRVAAPPGLFATAIPGGDGRETRAPGWVAGTPDCLLLWGGARQECGQVIFVEMKRRRGGRLAPEQVAVHQAIRHAGGIVVVAAGWEAAADFLCAILPMRDCRAQQRAALDVEARAVAARQGSANRFAAFSHAERLWLRDAIAGAIKSPVSFGSPLYREVDMTLHGTAQRGTRA